jgi:hypothetical protein
MLEVMQLVGFGDGAGRGTIQYVGGATARKSGTTSGTSTIPIDAGLTGGIASAAQSGDFVIGFFACGNSTTPTLSITDGSSDYTPVTGQIAASDTADTDLYAAYKRITSDTDVYFGHTASVENAAAMAVMVFRGVDATTPLDVAVVTATGTSDGNANPGSITPATNGAVIVAVGAAADVGVVDYDTFTSSDLTDFLTISKDDTYGIIIGVGYYQWISGAFDPAAFNVTYDSASDSWAAITFALRPA